MVKAVKYTTVAQEIKKEYLKEHLEQVKQLVKNWVSELSMPEPLSPHRGTWGWKSIYRPAIAIEPDNNHIIRHHLRSRTLWSHHGNWGRELDSIWHLINQVRQAANNIYTGKL